MATSGAFGTNNPYVKYTIDIRQNSQNVTANTSNVTVSVRFYRTNTGYKTWGSGTIWCKINGTTYSAGIVPSQEITNAGIVLFTKTLDIPHNADGTKNLSVSAWINMNSPLTSNEQGFSQNLTTIPRATTPELSPTRQTMGGRINITLNRASSSFTHKISYIWGDRTAVIANSVGTSAVFTIPLDFALQIPNNVDGYGDIVVDTYNNGVYIGSKRTRFEAVVPDSVAPAIDYFAAADTNSAIANKFNAFIANVSKMNINVSASGAYGSTVNKIVINYGSNEYTDSTAKNIPVMQSNNIVNVVVTDSRGRKTSRQYTLTVYQYTAPKIISFTATRCDADGNLSEDGTSLIYSLNFSLTSCNGKNDREYTVEYKKTADNSWNVLDCGNVFEYNGTKKNLNGLFDVDYSYNIRLTIRDYFSAISTEIELPTAFTLIDFHSNGKGISFGGVAEKDGFTVKMPAFFEKHMTFEDGFTLLDAKGNEISLATILYPIGMIVAFANYTNPNTVFKGTQWNKIAAGRVLVGQDENDVDFKTLGKIGGEKSHALTERELPSHTHQLSSDGQAHAISWGGFGKNVYAPINMVPGDGGNNYINTKQPEWNKTTSSGGGQSHNNLQPYQVVSYWIRVA